MSRRVRSASGWVVAVITAAILALGARQAFAKGALDCPYDPGNGMMGQVADLEECHQVCLAQFDGDLWTWYLFGNNCCACTF